MKKIWLSVVAMLLLGVAVGLVWQWQASPAEWEVRADGSIVLTELAARDQFGVIVVFVVAGAVASLVWGFASTLVLGNQDWWITPFVVITTLAAAVVAWRVGIELGPIGPAAAVDPQVGELLPSKLEVDARAPFLVWPFFGAVGMVIALVIQLIRGLNIELDQQLAEQLASESSHHS